MGQGVTEVPTARITRATSPRVEILRIIQDYMWIDAV